MNDTACSYFEFTKPTNSCKAYGESAVLTYQLHDPLVFGTKKSKRKSNHIKKIFVFIYNSVLPVFWRLTLKFKKIIL